MQLSDEIMGGSFYLRHQTGFLGDGLETGCVLQLAAFSRKESTLEPCHKTNVAHPWTKKFGVCPECKNRALFISIIACHLNDEHGWSLSQIIDYVRSVEPSEKILVDATPVEEVEYASMT